MEVFGGVCDNTSIGCIDSEVGPRVIGRIDSLKWACAEPLIELLAEPPTEAPPREN
jgi:hypothetical protein